MPAVHRLDLLQPALAQLCQVLEGARTAVIVTAEGFVVASYPPGDESFLEEGTAGSSQVAAMISTLTTLAARTTTRLGLGQDAIHRLLIEGSQGTLVVIPVNNETALAVVLDKEAKAGVAMAVAQRTAQQVRPALESRAQPSAPNREE